MTPEQLLYLVALALLLLESVVRIPPGHIAFVAGASGVFKPRDPWLSRGAQGSGALLLLPIPPLGRVIVVASGSALTEHDLTTAGIDDRLAAWRAETPTLRILSNLLWTFLFVVCPCVVAAKGLETSWLPLLVITFVMDSLIASEFFFAHRALFPDRKAVRVERTVTLLLSPVSAVRAEDALSRDIAGGATPVVVGVLLAGPRLPAAWLRRQLFDAGVLESDAERTLVARVDKFLSPIGMSTRKLSAPPEAPDFLPSAYCPRCHQSYTVQASACADCGTILVQQPASPEVRPTRQPGRSSRTR